MSMATGCEYDKLKHGTTLQVPVDKPRTLGNAGDETSKKRATEGGSSQLNQADQEACLAAFGGEFCSDPPMRQFADPAPLGLSASALTVFVLSLILVNTRSIGSPTLVVALAYGYGGLVQLLAGMWEMAAGNTFGATALSSYGGFWLSFAIILTPGDPSIESSLVSLGRTAFLDAFGLYLMGWFIWTFLLLLCTLRSTVASFLLFFTLDLAFLLLGIAYLQHGDTRPQEHCTVAAGCFGLMAAFFAWYNALAGITGATNSFIVIPVAHFPWSDKGRARRKRYNSTTTVITPHQTKSRTLHLTYSHAV